MAILVKALQCNKNWNSLPCLSFPESKWTSKPGQLPAKELQCVAKRLHAYNDLTFELSISTFSANARSDPTTAAALSYSERLALAPKAAAVGRATTTRRRGFVLVGAIAAGGCGSRAEPSIRARAPGKGKNRSRAPLNCGVREIGLRRVFERRTTNH